MLIRALLALLLILAVDWMPGIPPYPLLGMAQVKAQSSVPPDVWHPFRGGLNCIQVADSQGRFNCAAGTTVDPTTGNMVIAGTLAFQGLAAGTFANGLALAPVGTAVQLLGAGDLVIATSNTNIAPSGPLMQGAVLRVRRGPAGTCQLVISGGNSFGAEYIIPTIATYDPLPSEAALAFTLGLGAQGLQAYFPGGPGGC